MSQAGLAHPDPSLQHDRPRSKGKLSSNSSGSTLNANSRPQSNHANPGAQDYPSNKLDTKPLPVRPLGTQDISRAAFDQHHKLSASPSRDSQGSRSPGKDDAFAGTDTDDFYARTRSRNQSRTGSIYSISRESFTSHLSQLTSIQLPDADSLSQSITAIPTAPKATRALNDAAEQILSWIQKASQVLSGLDARDDVEWAADAGRDGLSEVDQAISRFESLIQVYVTAVEDLQSREDVALIPAVDMQHAVDQVEKIVKDWQGIKDTLKEVKRQVELGIDWEKLYQTIADEIGPEADAVSRHIFEMEERRHRVEVTEAQNAVAAGVEISELETILEDQPDKQNRTARLSKRYGAPQPREASSPPQSPKALAAKEDTDLLELFAKLQPLRASLDFLPMKLSSFRSHAGKVFPTACEELEERRNSLEIQWQRLQGDAETLKRELGEDQWLLVFRNCGGKALSMIGSIERSITRLDEALDSNTQLRHAPNTVKKVESYEAKKLHYCPAIERVLAIVERGIKDRLTVNGEIVRLQHDIQQKWRSTLMDMKNIDSTLEFYDAAKTQQLRDSVSSVMSSDRSFVSSNFESLGSSPPSSIGGRSRGTSCNRSETPQQADGRSRQASITSDHRPMTTTSYKRHSSLPLSSATTPASSRIPQKTPLTRSSAHESVRSVSSPTQRLFPITPPSRLSPRSLPSSSGPPKPRWNGSTVTNGNVGHNFKPLAVTQPSPYRKLPPQKHTPTPRRSTPTLRSSASANFSPLNRRTSAQPSPSPSNLSASTPPRTAQRKSRGPSSLMMSSPISEDGESNGTAFIDSPTEPPTRPGSSLTNGASITPGLAPRSHSRITSAGSINGTPSKATLAQWKRTAVSPSTK